MGWQWGGGSHLCFRSKAKCSFSRSLVMVTRNTQSKKLCFLHIRSRQAQLQSLLVCPETYIDNNFTFCQCEGRIVTGDLLLIKLHGSSPEASHLCCWVSIFFSCSAFFYVEDSLFHIRQERFFSLLAFIFY